MATTPRWGIPFPQGTDAADVPAWMEDLAVSLDDHAKDDQGPLASRPVSSVASPGKAGRYYFATDEGNLYRDHGTGWTKVISASVAADDLDPSLGAIRVTAGSGGSPDNPGVTLQFKRAEVQEGLFPSMSLGPVSRGPVFPNRCVVAWAGGVWTNDRFSTGVFARAPANGVQPECYFQNYRGDVGGLVLTQICALGY